MSGDESRRDRGPSRLRSSQRPIEAPVLPEGPLRTFKLTLYELYLQAGQPRMLDLENEISRLAESVTRYLFHDDEDELPQREVEVDELLGAPAPKRDTINAIIGGNTLPGTEDDAVAVAVALAYVAGRLVRGGRTRSLAALADQVRRLWIAAKTAPPQTPRLGRSIGEWSPTALEVHPAIVLIDHPDRLPELPVYVPRAHDRQLRRAVNIVTGAGETGTIADGRSMMVTLVGGSSTGKTRACWEAVQSLPDKWQLWHPIDPARPQAAADVIDQVGPHTVVWLNEAQHYLLDPTLGERIAAGLRTLLADPARSPVLILATLWPEFWSTATTRNDPDRYAQVRELLAGTAVVVPDGFKGSDFTALREKAAIDPRLDFAARLADGGRVTQHLAGVPVLVERYRFAGPVVQAAIHVAMDARRLGHPLSIPRVLLERAAPGYLSDYDWQQAGDDWLDEALAYTAKPSHGIAGPLTRVRPRPGEPPSTQPCYRLADYLEQTGRAERGGIFPPAAFWSAIAATVDDSHVLHGIATQAERRGRYGRAAQMYQRAAECGDPLALWNLGRLRERAGHQGDEKSAAEALYRRAADRGDVAALTALARLREEAGDGAAAEALYRQGAELGDLSALGRLARMREDAGDLAGAEELYWEAAGHGDASAFGELARLREDADDVAAAEELYWEAAGHGDASALGELARLREETGDRTGAEELALRAARQGNTFALRALGRLRERAGDQAAAENLYGQGFELGDFLALDELARLQELAGNRAAAEQWYEQVLERGYGSAFRARAGFHAQGGDRVAAQHWYRAAAQQGDLLALEELARLREDAGDRVAAEKLYRQAVDRGDAEALQELARLREQAGDRRGAERIRRFGLSDMGDPAASANW